jgi:hypothetical protein
LTILSGYLLGQSPLSQLKSFLQTIFLYGEKTRIFGRVIIFYHVFNNLAWFGQILLTSEAVVCAYENQVKIFSQQF